MTFFVTAATRNEYVPAASPVAVQVRTVDDFVAPFAHPPPAPAQAPPVPVATCTSNPTTDCVRVELPLLSHDTTAWPPSTPAIAFTDAVAGSATNVKFTDSLVCVP